ncbi:hypothetical protein INR49_020361 [Caranx melampygus]|nr:hypothetical protein INR49_020361 [Caranx melampygus]
MQIQLRSLFIGSLRSFQSAVKNSRDSTETEREGERESSAGGHTSDPREQQQHQEELSVLTSASETVCDRMLQTVATAAARWTGHVEKMESCVDEAQLNQPGADVCVRNETLT